MGNYKRVLLKLSGEQLAGKFEAGIDPEVANYFASEVKKARKGGCEIILVVGGGNLVRGAEVAGQGIKRVTGDHMGMLSGLINAMAITDIFEHNGIETRCLSNIFCRSSCRDVFFSSSRKAHCSWSSHYYCRRHR